MAQQVHKSEFDRRIDTERVREVTITDQPGTHQVSALPTDTEHNQDA